MVLRTTAARGSFGAGEGAGRADVEGSIFLRIVNCLISADGLEDIASILGRPSKDEGEAVFSRNSVRCDWRLSATELLLAVLVQVVDFEAAEGDLARSSLRADSSNPKS